MKYDKHNEYLKKHLVKFRINKSYDFEKNEKSKKF